MKRSITFTVDVETVTFEGTELIGVRGIKQLTGYGSSAVSNLISRRNPEFPKPVISLGEDRGTIRLWRFDDIERWWLGKKVGRNG